MTPLTPCVNADIASPPPSSGESISFPPIFAGGADGGLPPSRPISLLLLFAIFLSMSRPGLGQAPPPRNGEPTLALPRPSTFAPAGVPYQRPQTPMARLRFVGAETNEAEADYANENTEGAHVHFGKLQHLTRELDESVQAEDQIFGQLMSEVDALSGALKRQRKMRELDRKEREEAEARADAIETELAQTRETARDALRQAERVAAELKARMAACQPAEPPRALTVPPQAAPSLSLPHPPQAALNAEGNSENEQESHPAAPPAVTEAPELPVAAAPEHPEPPPTSGAGSQDDSEAIAPPPQPATDHAIDRQALADSLFATGEYRLALATYRALLEEEKKEGESGTAKSSWLRYQVAGCYRHLGEFPQAESYYRDVTSDQSDVFLADMAQWWLANLKQRKVLAGRVQQWQMVVRQLEKETK